MKPYLKNWKTTALGLGGAALYAYELSIQGGCGLVDWQCWAKPVILGLIGFFARDANKSSEQSIAKKNSSKLP